MKLEQLFSVNFSGIGMAQKLNFLESKEEHVVGRVDGAGDTVDRVSDWNASAKNRVILNIIDAKNTFKALIDRSTEAD